MLVLCGQVVLDGRAAHHVLRGLDAERLPTLLAGRRTLAPLSKVPPFWSDGSQIDRIRVTTGANGAAVANIGHLYGDAEGVADGEIITVTGSYPTA